MFVYARMILWYCWLDWRELLCLYFDSRRTHRLEIGLAM